MPSRLTHVYFKNQESFFLISAEIKKWKEDLVKEGIWSKILHDHFNL